LIIVVILIVAIWLAVLRVYRVATGKLFLKPATNRLEHQWFDKRPFDRNA
jgi:hypothetical protein